MKVVSLRKSRLLKVILVIVVFILLVAFFIPKPKGNALLSGKFSKSRLVPPRLGPIFKEGVLGNFEPAPTETVREGPGENGMAHYARSEDQNEISIAMMEYGINMVVSNQISMDRSIPDKRLRECKYWHYPKDLPSTSVIIVFHNEGFSTLLRTVHSVINRSPPEFLKEVVLVDDFSDKENLKGELEDYIRQFGQKVRLTRNKQREGLIRSRTYGAEFSKGEVIVFLDAHCEVNVNWLPPLLAPIYTNRTVMTVPVIDGIDKDNFEYRPVYQGEKHFRGIFEWGMLYKEIEIPEEEVRRRRYHSEPYKSPTHAGGLFAINREYFLELGAYDPGLLVWGGENFELSFKIWQCGGSIEWVPCSRVGHIYRGFMPYTFGKLAEQRKGPLVTLNYKRVVEVWMDEYKDYFYIREPIARQYDHGDVSGQLAIRERLQCKSFKWFMDNVAYDVLYKFPLLPKNLFWGEVFRLNAEGQLGVGERCVDADTDHVKLVFCSLGTVNGPWEYNEVVSFTLIGVAAYGIAASFITSLTIVGGIIACGVFLFLLSLMGLIGAVRHSQVLLFFYMVILFFLFVAQFSIACACLAFNEDQQHKIASEGWRQASVGLRNETQLYFDCCGFENATLPEGDPMQQVDCSYIPFCQKHPSVCEESRNTCWRKLQTVINNAVKISGGIGLFFSFSEFIGVWLTVRYRNQKDPRSNPHAFL